MMGRGTREVLGAGWWPRLAAGAAMRFRRGRVERVVVIRVGLGS